MLKELNYTICVENMSARQLGASFGTKLASVADRAKFVLVHAMEVPRLFGTSRIEARHAFALLGDSFASMATLECLIAKDCFFLRLTGIDLFYLLFTLLLDLLRLFNFYLKVYHWYLNNDFVIVLVRMTFEQGWSFHLSEHH